MKRKLYVWQLLLLILILVGCQPLPPLSRQPIFREAWNGLQKQETGSETTGSITDPADDQRPADSAKVNLVEVPGIGTDVSKKPVQSLMDSSEAALQLSAKEKVKIAVENMPIGDFVNLVFGKLLKLTYTTGTDLKASKEKITLNMNEEVSARDFYSVVLVLLEQRGFQVQAKNHLLLVTKAVVKRSKKGHFNNNVFWGRDVPLLSPSAKITQVFPIYYADVPVVYNMAKKFVRDPGQMSFDLQMETGSVMISGSVEDVRQIVHLIQAFDQPYSAGKSIQLLYLDYMSSRDFIVELKKILPGLGIPLAKQNRTGLRLIPVTSLNAVLIIAAQPTWIDTVVYWKEKIDTLLALGDDKNLFVYHPKYRIAEELMDVVTKTLGSAKAQPSQSKEGATSIKNSSTCLSEMDAEISVDKGRNALVIFTYPTDYKKIHQVLQQLDIPPRQVLVEVTVAEITLTDQLEYGLEWYFREHGGTYGSELQTLGGLGLGGSGFNYALTKVGGNFQAMLNAFAKNNNINIISTPHVIVTDGKEATINVGTEVPVVTSETSAADISGTTTSSILRNVQYRNTGVILSVTPVIHSAGMVTIEVRQELSEAQTNNVSDISSPLILNRSIHTSLALQSGETVLLGGLISENRSNTDSKVPVLGDIPWLGNLFKSKSRSVNKTELVIKLTPYILSEMRQLDQLTRSLEKSAVGF